MMMLMKSMLLPLLSAIAMLVSAATMALAVQPDEILPDMAQEQRARAISAGLRCLVCQNQSIDDSDAPLAKDLRIIVRERIKAGDNDEAVVNYVVERYGDYVLLKPPLNAATLLLWISPLLVLIAGIWLGRKVLRGETAATESAAPLSDAEKKKLDEMLKQSS